MRSSTILQSKYTKVFVIFCVQHVHFAISNVEEASSNMVISDPLQYLVPKMLSYRSPRA